MKFFSLSVFFVCCFYIFAGLEVDHNVVQPSGETKNLEGVGGEDLKLLPSGITQGHVNDIISVSRCFSCHASFDPNSSRGAKTHLASLAIISVLEGREIPDELYKSPLKERITSRILEEMLKANRPSDDKFNDKFSKQKYDSLIKKLTESTFEKERAKFPVEGLGPIEAYYEIHELGGGRPLVEDDFSEFQQTTANKYRHAVTKYLRNPENITEEERRALSKGAIEAVKDHKRSVKLLNVLIKSGVADRPYGEKVEKKDVYSKRQKAKLLSEVEGDVSEGRRREKFLNSFRASYEYVEVKEKPTLINDRQEGPLKRLSSESSQLPKELRTVYEKYQKHGLNVHREFKGTQAR